MSYLFMALIERDDQEPQQVNLRLYRTEEVIELQPNGEYVTVQLEIDPYGDDPDD